MLQINHTFPLSPLSFHLHTHSIIEMRNKPFLPPLLLLLLLLTINQAQARPFVIVLTPDDFDDTTPPAAPPSSTAWDDFGYSNYKPEEQLDPGSWRPLFEPSYCPSSPSDTDLELNYYSPLRNLFSAAASQDFDLMSAAAGELEARAKKGNPHAQSALGWLYGSGQLRNKSEAKAFLYHSFASLGGNMHSRMALAYHYYTRNMHDKAVKLYADLAEVALSSFLTSEGPLVEPVRIHNGTMENTEASENSRLLDDDIIEIRENQAQRGDARRMYEIGTDYYSGSRGVHRDHRKAFSFIWKAAEKGEPRAMELLGEIYARGAGVEKNYTEALNWFTRASKQQHVSAYNGMGYLHLKGFGVEKKNYAKAKEYFKKAEENKDSGAYYNLAVLYLNGIGVKKDARTACHYFIKAANAGQPKAFFQLAKMFHTGIGLRKNLGIATALYKLVAEQGPWSSLSRWALGSYLKPEVGKALLLYTRMAELGYEVAQSNAAWILKKHVDPTICLGGSYFCTDTEWYQHAHALWWQASEQGSGHAALQIGDASYSGKDTKRDYEHAAEFYMRARFQSIVKAMYNLGFMHKHGLGLPYDLHLAKRYYDEALENEPASSRVVMVNLIGLAVTVIVIVISSVVVWCVFWKPAPVAAAVTVPVDPTVTAPVDPAGTASVDPAAA